MKNAILRNSLVFVSIAALLFTTGCKDSAPGSSTSDSSGSAIYTYELRGEYSGGFRIREKKRLVGTYTYGSRRDIDFSTKTGKFETKLTTSGAKKVVFYVNGNRGGGKIHCVIVVKRDGHIVKTVDKSKYGEVTCLYAP